MPKPKMLRDSMRLMSPTNCEVRNSLHSVTALAMSAAGKPEYCQRIVTVGSSIAGKMSFGMRVVAPMPARISISDRTTKV